MVTQKLCHNFPKKGYTNFQLCRIMEHTERPGY